MNEKDNANNSGVTRRAFLQTSAAFGIAAAIGNALYDGGNRYGG